MAGLTKRATIYIEPDLHKALRLKSVETSLSMSEIINDTLREALSEDAEDLAEFEKRGREPTLSFENFLKELKRNGKL